MARSLIAVNLPQSIFEQIVNVYVLSLLSIRRNLALYGILLLFGLIAGICMVFLPDANMIVCATLFIITSPVIVIILSNTNAIGSGNSEQDSLNMRTIFLPLLSIWCLASAFAVLSMGLSLMHPAALIISTALLLLVLPIFCLLLPNAVIEYKYNPVAQLKRSWQLLKPEFLKCFLALIVFCVLLAVVSALLLLPLILLVMLAPTIANITKPALFCGIFFLFCSSAQAFCLNLYYSLTATEKYDLDALVDAEKTKQTTTTETPKPVVEEKPAPTATIEPTTDESVENQALNTEAEAPPKPTVAAGAEIALEVTKHDNENADKQTDNDDNVFDMDELMAHAEKEEATPNEPTPPRAQAESNPPPKKTPTDDSSPLKFADDDDE